MAREGEGPDLPERSGRRSLDKVFGCLGMTAHDGTAQDGTQRAARRSAARFERSRWTLRYLNPELEDAFLKRRQAKVFKNIGRLMIVTVLVMIPMFVGSLRAHLDGDNDYSSFSGDLRVVVTLGFLTLLSSVICLLARLSCVQQFVGVRGYEMSVTCLQLLLLAMFMFAFEVDVESITGKDVSYLHFLIAKLALGMDTVLTVSHLALPVRWSVMLWVEILYAAVFAAICISHAGFSSNIPLLFTGLAVGASVGLRAMEKSERDLFATVVDERTLRTQAEFSAGLAGLRSGRPAEGQANQRSPSQSRSGSQPDDMRSTHSAPTTTASGALFGQLGSLSTQANGQALADLKDLGIQEQWLISADDLAVLADRVLGRGGQAQVISGTFHCSPVAVKRYEKSTLRRNPKGFCGREVFNELRIMRHVRHPNLVLFHGAYISNVGSEISLVMEKVDGLGLADFVSHMHLEDDALVKRTFPSVGARADGPKRDVPKRWIARSLGQAIDASEHAFARRRIMQGVCQALAYLHARKPCIVHGDLKPDNVMVEWREAGPFAKLLDFGLSRAVTRTTQGMLGGSPNYMAPELLPSYYGPDPNGLDPGVRPSPAADTFSLGRLLFLVSKGQRQIWSKATRGVAERTVEVQGDVMWPPSPVLVRRWGTTIEWCTATEACERPTAAEVHRRIFEGVETFGELRSL